MTSEVDRHFEHFGFGNHALMSNFSDIGNIHR